MSPQNPNMSSGHDETEPEHPPVHSPLSEILAQSPRKHEPSPEEFSRVATSPEFIELRRKFKRFAFPMTAVFLVWYFAYVLMSVYARDFMSTPIFGNVNLGTILGLGQFFTTFLITWLYIRHANKNLDPMASQLRAELEAQR